MDQPGKVANSAPKVHRAALGTIRGERHQRAVASPVELRGRLKVQIRHHRGNRKEGE